MAFSTFDPKDCTLIVGGVIIGGFTDGTKLSVERANDAYTLKVGLDGDEQVRNRNNNKSGTITCTLLATSASRAYLQSKIEADEKDNTGAFEVLLKTPQEQYSSVNAFIQKIPSASFEGEVSDREYMIMCPELIASIPATTAPTVEA